MESDEFIEVTLNARIKPHAENVEAGVDQYDKIGDRLIAVMQQSGEVEVDVLEVHVPDALAVN